MSDNVMPVGTPVRLSNDLDIHGRAVPVCFEPRMAYAGWKGRVIAVHDGVAPLPAYDVAVATDRTRSGVDVITWVFADEVEPLR